MIAKPLPAWESLEGVYLTGSKHFRCASGFGLALMLFFFCEISGASPLRLTVRPQGTNQVELTLSPVITNIYYAVLTRTNGPKGHWIMFAGLPDSGKTTLTATCDLGHVQGLTLGTLKNWTFAAGRWDDPLGDELPPLYKELVLRSDPYADGDPYGDPMGDGWSNLQKLQNEMDPLACYAPPSPSVSVAFHGGATQGRYGDAILTWEMRGGPLPDYFAIERAIRIPRPMTNDARLMSLGPNGPIGSYPANWPTNRSLNMRTNRSLYSGTNRPLNWTTNHPFMGRTNGPTNLSTNRPYYRPPNFRPGNGRPASPIMETGPFIEIARVPSRIGLTQYRYVETNVDTLFQPLYRLVPHNVPPSRAYLRQVDAEGIRGTIISATAQQTTNGFALTIPHPVPYGWYLLLVRDKNDPQWRASGYFESGTNRNPVNLIVDKQGMMSDGQRPIAMPPIKFLPDVVEPEFTAGWGEDSDGDGLPDVYEVLVTHTDPNHADTGNTGILDGFKEMTDDGWNNLEKFRRRADPLQAARPPAAVELKQPTVSEIFQAMTPKTGLHAEVEIGIRTNGTTNFQPLENVPWLLSKVLNYREQARKDFDVRVSWKFAEPRFDHGGVRYPGEPSWYEAVEPLIDRINLKLIMAFKAHLETNPPVSWNEASNITARTLRDYHGGELDKGFAMAKMMLLAENVSQDFYGRAVDQHGQPIAEVTVTGTVTRESGGGTPAKTQTDSRGFFQFAGLRGRSISIALEKQGFQIEGHGLGLRNVNGPETSLTNRALFTMWKLKGPEALIHDKKNHQLKSNDRVYTLDLLSKKLVEGTNEPGDLYVQFKRPQQIKRQEHYPWSFTMTAIGGGFIAVADDEYLNEAPVKGYQPVYSLNMIGTDPKWRNYHEQTFYIKSRNGQAYGHFHIKIYPDSRDGSALEIESFVNPSGSRNLEFDPARQTEYVPKTEPGISSSVLPVAEPPRLFSANRSGQIVSWGSMVLPFVNPKTRFVAVAAGGEHSLALSSDGKVIAWGRNLSGESSVPDGLSNVVALAAGGRSNKGFSVALKRDGHVVAWGDNDVFQTSVPAGLSNVVAISAGTDHCLALKKDGTVVGWGFNEDSKTQSPPGLSNVVAVAAGEEHSVALKKDGTVVAWGRNQWGQTNVPPGLANVVAICSGSYFGLALTKDGRIVMWGSTFNKESNLPQGLTNVTAIAAGPWNAMALKKDGALVVWGRETFLPTHVPAGLKDVLSFAGGGSDHGGHCLAIKTDGTIVGWGNNNYGQSLSPGGTTGIVSIAAGLDHYLAIRADGSVIGWGGQEHQGNGQAWVPAALGPVSFVAGGQDHSLAVRSDKTVVAWGYDNYGQMTLPGNLTNISAVAAGYNHSLALSANGVVFGWGASHLSKMPASLSNVAAISVGAQFSLALKHDGSVLAWEANGSVMRVVPDDVSNIVAIAAGPGDQVLALRSDGTVIAWGGNSAGQTNVPPGLTNVTAIAAGVGHNLALRRDGTLVAWGANNAGQAAIPPGLGHAIAIAAGGSSSVAIVVPLLESSEIRPRFACRLIASIAICAFCIAGFWLLLRRAGFRIKFFSSDQ
jgi:alpha-tubulin suppressor-like RCC1 family protein